MANFNFIIVFYSIRVASLMVVKCTAFSVPPKCQSYNILYRINILIGLTLINTFIKTKQISYSLVILLSKMQLYFNWVLTILQCPGFLFGLRLRPNWRLSSSWKKWRGGNTVWRRWCQIRTICSSTKAVDGELVRKLIHCLAIWAVEQAILL